MVANQILDTVQFTTKQTAKESGSKSYAENSNEFENIFDDINKSYSKDSEKSSKSTDKNVTKNEASSNEHSQKTETSKNEEKNNKVEDKQSPDKTEVTNTDTNNTADKTEASANQDQKVAAETQENTSTKTQAPESSEATTIEKINVEYTVKSEPNKMDIETQVKANEEGNNLLQAELIENKNDSTQQKKELLPEQMNTQTFEELATIITSQASNSDSKTAEVKPEAKTELGNETNLTKDIDVSNETMPASPIQIAEATLDILTKNAIGEFIQPTEINVSVAQTVGIQPKQIVNESKNNEIIAQDSLANQNTQQTPVAEAQMPINELSIQNNNQSPLVKVAAEVAVETGFAANLKNTDTNKLDQNSTIKTNLTQETLDSMNVEITKVETANSSGQNFNMDSENNQPNTKGLLSQQTTQEQTIKLELAENTTQVASTPESTQSMEMPISQNTQNPINTTGAAQTQAQSQTSRELSQSDILSQINKQINLKNSQNLENTKVNIILRPENLGKIELELVSTKDGLTARMTTENAQVKAILDKSMDSLKETLGSQGVSVNNVTVKVNETTKQDTMFSFNDQQTGQGQQQPQQNTRQTNENNTQFDTNDLTDASSNELESESENLTEKTNNNGNVDYKV